ncbi:ribosomal RNA processing protein 36 homolog [Condylostylus longicornis]|uniref:ribosomal RNA processing protein 36 homolog n=1 Tax=Condylostylus longicornis TaxID=2530218 RepID=UPI00244DFD76|nr:ribosomal RNA processing protein 36 homolog [Condylostylus longicornis]
MDSSESEENSDIEPTKEDDQERTAIREELSSMSFEDLMKLKDELGSKVYNEAIFGSKNKKISKINKSDFKRANKNRPREISSKRQVPFLGVELRKPLTATETRDPRYDEKCGEYSSSVFKNNYSFVNEIRENELQKLKNKLKKASGEEKSEIKFAIQRLENQLREEKAWKTRESIKNEAIKEIQIAKKEGRKPHYATKKELRTKELVKQFEDLKSSGRLAKHLEKKRKKNIVKDRKKIELNV